MTRPFNTRIRCEHCGGMTTEESPIERWIRNNPRLDSKNGMVRFDIDILLHRYKTLADQKSEREIEFMMFIEVKTHGAPLSLSQRDTLGLLNQVLRNRQPNLHGSPRRQIDGQPKMLYSYAKGREIQLRLLGGHLLTLSQTDPLDSLWMEWDNQRITQGILIDLLLFDRDPDNLDAKKEDWLRRRSAPFGSMLKQLSLPIYSATPCL